MLISLLFIYYCLIMKITRRIFPIFYPEKKVERTTIELPSRDQLEEVRIHQENLQQEKQRILLSNSFVENLKLADKHSINKKLLKKRQTNNLDLARALEEKSKQII